MAENETIVIDLGSSKIELKNTDLKIIPYIACEDRLINVKIRKKSILSNTKSNELPPCDCTIICIFIIIIIKYLGLIRAGFAGEDAPRSVFPTIIGGSRLPIVMCGVTVKKNCKH